MVSLYILGYGRMGKKIHELSGSLSTEVVGTNNGDTSFLDDPALADADVIIDFSVPTSALFNIIGGLKSGLPVVSGTTGWLDHWDEVEEVVKKHEGRFFYASNFSFGANVLFYLNEVLSRIMSTTDDYHPSMTEIHHTKKLDKPSGTAATLADDVVRYNDLQGWMIDDKKDGYLPIVCKREGDVKGFHEVIYTSEIDEVRISHNAFSRDGFAKGAIEASKWLTAQDTGIYGMKDMMGLKS